MIFLFSEYTHWSFHYLEPKSALGLKLRKHHFAYHFHNAKLNHGVTSTVLDRLLGTYIEDPKVKTPKKVLLPWMLTEDKSNIAAKFSNDFEIRYS